MHLGTIRQFRVERGDESPSRLNHHGFIFPFKQGVDGVTHVADARRPNENSRYGPIACPVRGRYQVTFKTIELAAKRISLDGDVDSLQRFLFRSFDVPGK